MITSSCLLLTAIETLLNYPCIKSIIALNDADLFYGIRWQSYLLSIVLQAMWLVSLLNLHCHGYNVVIGRSWGVEGLDFLTFQYHYRPTPTGGNQRSRRKSVVSVYLSHSWNTTFSEKQLSDTPPASIQLIRELELFWRWMPASLADSLGEMGQSTTASGAGVGVAKNTLFAFTQNTPMTIYF